MMERDINSIHIPLWHLEYITNDNELFFILKVDEVEYENFKKESNSEFFVSILDDGYLCLAVNTLGIRDGSKATIEIDPLNKDAAFIIEDLNRIISCDTVKFFVFTENKKEICVELKVFGSDKVTIRKWLGQKIDYLHSSFEFHFSEIPVDYMVPYKTDTFFWFMCKTKNTTFAYIKNNLEKIKFEANLIKGVLVLHLSAKKLEICSICFSNVLDSCCVMVDDNVREDFNIFLKYDVITFVLNNEKGLDDSVITVGLKIDNEAKNLIRSFINRKASVPGKPPKNGGQKNTNV